MRTLLLAAIASIGLVGCVGELDTTGTGNGDGTGNGTGTGSGSGSGSGSTSSAAKAIYEADVHPIMLAKCQSCHKLGSPISNLSGFVDTNLATAHATITSFTSVVGSFAPTTAPVLLKVAPGHQGVNYTTEETSKITAWLEQEVIDQNGGGGGTGSGSGGGQTETPAAASQRVLANWSACMTKTNFDAADMAQAWGNLTAQNNQKCSGCHASGDGGFFASPDGQLFFDVISQNKYYMLQYFRVKLDLANLQNSMIEINKDSFLGVSNGQDPHREHPRFNPTTNNGMEALQEFYTSTAAAVAAGNCGPTKLTN